MNIILTGGSSGLGADMLKIFKSRGDRVYMLSRSNPENVEDFYPCDVTDEAQVKTTLEEIGKACKKIDVLINNAGVGLSGATELLETERVKSVMDINFTGTFLVSKYALPYMGAGSKIINISSVTAFFPLAFRVIYCAAKSAVNSLTFGMRMELKSSGIQVMAICPGDTKTNFTKNRIKDFATSDRYGDRIKKSAESIDSREGKRMPSAKVAAKIVRIADKRKLPPFKIIGAKYKALYTLTKFFPLSAYLSFMEKHFSGK